jgi:hypothetical protein
LPLGARIPGLGVACAATGCIAVSSAVKRARVVPFRPVDPPSRPGVLSLPGTADGRKARLLQSMSA